MAIEAGHKWQLIKVISVYRIDVVEGQEVQFEDETLIASSNDFFFAIAYSTSKKFANFKQLEKAMQDKAWAFENICTVCRVTAFPEYNRYIGFGEVTQQERESFNTWKTLFKKGKTKVA